MKLPAQLAMVYALILPLCGFAHGAQQSDAKEAQKKFCTEQIERRTAAIIANDLQQLAVEADTYIRKCESIFGADSLSRAHGDRITAYSGMKKPKQALQAADVCLKIFYGNVGCHVGRAKALLGLERVAEALTSLERAERLAAGTLENLEREMFIPAHPSDLETTKVRIEELKALQMYAATLRRNIEFLVANK